MAFWASILAFWASILAFWGFHFGLLGLPSGPLVWPSGASFCLFGLLELHFGLLGLHFGLLGRILAFWAFILAFCASGLGLWGFILSSGRPFWPLGLYTDSPAALRCPSAVLVDKLALYGGPRGPWCHPALLGDILPSWGLTACRPSTVVLHKSVPLPWSWKALVASWLSRGYPALLGLLMGIVLFWRFPAFPGQHPAFLVASSLLGGPVRLGFLLRLVGGFPAFLGVSWPSGGAPSTFCVFLKEVSSPTGRHPILPF